MMLRPILLSLLLSLLAVAQETASATQAAPTTQQSPNPPNTGYNGGEDNPQDPSDAGAEGASKGAFALSKGGLIAIIVVAVIVAVVGAASAILFYLAKKRQWDVRQSLRRASRRLTGRSDVSKRQNRRTGVRLNSPPPGRNARPKQDRDIEKGMPAATRNGKITTTISSAFDVDTPTPQGWKSSMLGGKK